MDDGERFATVCRVLNRVLKQRETDSIELQLDKQEAAELVRALVYYRGAVDPSSGDVIIGTEYSCPECGSNEIFRAQDRNVSLEAEHPDIGVEVFRVQGIAQCSECTFQVDLNQFSVIQLDEFDEDAWKDRYEAEYQGREYVEILRSS